jgi:hypothetical protein
MNKTNINSMNEAEKKLFAIFVAELMKNKIITDEDWLDDEEELGEYVVEDDSGLIEVGPIVYDPTKADPKVIRENVLERKNDKKKK